MKWVWKDNVIKLQHCLFLFQGTIMTHVLGICTLNRFESCVGHSHCVRIFMQDFGVRPSSYTTSQPAATHALVWYCWWFKNPKKQADRSFIPLFTGFYASFRWLTTPDFWTINSIDWWHRAPTLHAIPSKEMMNQTGRTQNNFSMTSGSKLLKSIWFWEPKQAGYTNLSFLSLIL